MLCIYDAALENYIFEIATSHLTCFFEALEFTWRVSKAGRFDQEMLSHVER